MKPSKEELNQRIDDYLEFVKKLEAKGLPDDIIEEAEDELLAFYKELDEENERKEKQKAERRMRGDAEPPRRDDRNNNEGKG